MVWATWSKGRELADLREKQKDLLGQLAGGSEAPTVSMTAEPPEDSNTPELLQLRAEVSRLARRKQEVGSVLAENRRLKTQLASISTNTQTTLPPGYIRKFAAWNVGY